MKLRNIITTKMVTLKKSALLKQLWPFYGMQAMKLQA
ncbi:unnamed protein product [Acanthoscelides obtectus]|uniref:Uncharacterized protein n=1 Tax=Acanthoscelides obtectus TaxID=200917 RepID=A0A9P0KLZ3_ACAOB|nr:unnamed protein product [Acanthoscelides obtectus]CAK1646448.1 hypothetical protein AOBTE_LOCUS14638 [Acanthoscelides obtectus]